MNAPEGRSGPNSALRPCRLDVRFAQKRTRPGDEYTPELDAARRSRALSRAGSTARPAARRYWRGGYWSIREELGAAGV